ncbi:helix-turn-helix domain-containing protein [Micromonospora sp. NPDC023956]|uniref:helix-turn-helix domain-containing protein n=1 Tax=Micromonospora sp. NPDC023956 TaxID=3155722 RepID=UPI0033F11878
MDTKQWLDQKQLTELLNVPATWVRDKVTARAIPHRRVGRHVRFTPADVAEIEQMFFEPAITETPSRTVTRVRRAARRAAA